VSKLHTSEAPRTTKRSEQLTVIPMKILAFLLVVLGSGLTALGFSGWQATGGPGLWISESLGYMWNLRAGWTLLDRMEITVGVMLLVCGLLLRRDQRPNAP
jgi:hypothetical protein